MWAFFRCMWINLVRIKNWLGKVCPNGDKNSENKGILTKTAELLTILLLFLKIKSKYLLLEANISYKSIFASYS